MRPEHDPRIARRRRWLALGISALAHCLLFFVVIRGTPPRIPTRVPTLINLPPPEQDQDRMRPTRYYTPRVDQGLGDRRTPLPPTRPAPADTLPPPITEPLLPRTPDSAAVPRSPVGRIGPALGDGRLWVRPLPLPPRALAERLRPDHIELVDSAVTAIVQQYLDSIAREPGADQVKLPDWTTEIEGSKFGLDSRNIYIAGLKIPAAVLALLPIPSGGNQQRALDHNGQWIAEDLRRAAQRANTIDEFKRAVRELRLEKQRQKDLERAQREPPDSGGGER